MLVSSPGFYLCFWPIGYKLDVPKTPLPGLINLPERLRGLKEIFYLLGHQFIIKGYNLGTVRWRRYIGQSMGKELEAAKSSPGASRSTTTCSSTQKLSKPHPFGFLWSSLYIRMTDAILGHWWLIQSSACLPSQRSGLGVKVSTFWSHSLFFWQSTPILFIFYLILEYSWLTML